MLKLGVVSALCLFALNKHIDHLKFILDPFHPQSSPDLRLIQVINGCWYLDSQIFS